MCSKAWWGTIFFVSLSVGLFGQTSGSLDSTFNKTGKFFYQIDRESYFHRSTAVAVTSERIYLLGIYLEDRSDKIGILALKSDGTFDPTFGEEGVQTVAVSESDYATDIAVQVDGKILISGFTDDDIFVIRLNHDGSMDHSWGDNGVAITSVTTTWDRLNKVTCQPDGKVVAAGYCGTSVNDLVVVRYNANGTLDTAFGTSGKFIFDFDGSLDRIEGLALQPDGKIVIAGTGNIIGQSEGFVMRLATNGVLDPSFNTTGIVTLEDDAVGVAIQPGGKILCASATGDYVGGVYCFNQNGSTDTSFGVNGFASSGLRMAAIDVACTADGNFYMFGYSYGSPSRDFVAAYFRKGGSLQTCFGNSGISKFDVGSQANEEWQGKDNTEDYLSKGVLQPDGKLLLTGDNQSNEYILVRLTNVGQSIVQSKAEICQGDKYAFGSELLTAAGVYQRTFTSEDGCDAREILTLSVRPTYSHQVSRSICSGESIVFDGKTLSSTGTYVGHFRSIAGCDSTVTLSLSVNLVYKLSTDRTICQGESVVFGNQVLTTAGTYTNRFRTIHGCDSTVALSLSVNPAYKLSTSQTICQGESVVFGSQTLTTAGTYTNRLKTIHGCDSIITLSLYVNAAYERSTARTICQGESIVFGNQTLTASGTYTNQFRTIHGCDSIVHMSLSVIDIDNRINRNDNVLTAVEPNASYQWMSSDGVAIRGQIDREFRPRESGIYSVRVEKGGCSAVSEGVSVTIIVLGVEKPEAGSIYPNPSRNHVILTLPEFRSPLSVLLKDVNGRTVRIWNNVEAYSGAELDLTGVAAGVYFLHVGDEQRTFINRIIKVD